MRLLLLCMLLAWPAVHSYNILCIFSVPSRSHSILGKGVVNSLLKAGHEVTWVTPYPPKEPIKGVKIIDVHETIAITANVDMTKVQSVVTGFSMLLENVKNISMTTLNSALQKTLLETQFDAVVTELFYNDFDAGYAAIQGIPWIALSGTTLQPAIQSKVDAVNTIPTLPIMFTDFKSPMNLWQRLVTAAIYLAFETVNLVTKSSNEAVYEKMFKKLADARGVTLPPLADAASNISVLFLNSHISFTDPISLPPNVVEVAGYHLDETIPPLPKDLQALMDSSPQGVIYFSMGSVVKSTLIPLQTRKDLIQKFSALPHTVLWKFDEELDNLPPNVHIRKWMPQASILAHPNLRVFITHGGMLSQIEAISAGVPLISLPVFGDQPANARRAESLGFAKALTFDIPTLPQQIKQALTTILGDDKYYKRAKELSAMFNKRPVPPSKLISHYIEVAIETKGGHHLRSKSLLYTWYQRCMIDLVAVVLIALLVIYKLLRVSICFVVRRCKSKNVNVKNNKSSGKNKLKTN